MESDSFAGQIGMKFGMSTWGECGIVVMGLNFELPLFKKFFLSILLYFSVFSLSSTFFYSAKPLRFRK